MSQQNSLRKLQPFPDRKGLSRVQPGPLSSMTVKASSACTACRLRRSKCSTDSPCRGCLRANTVCVYDESSDRRRKIAEKRTADRLLHTRELFSNLLETLRFGQPDQVDHVLRVVRFDTSLKDIVDTILHTRQNIANVDPTRSLSLNDLDDLSTDIFTTSQIKPYHKALSLQELCCDSPFQMHCLRWTRVADGKVTSYLVSVYLTWYQPFIHILDENAFLNDMSNGTSKFCSSVLINAICALVSSWIGIDRHLDLAFWKECLVCLQNERGKPSLPTIQALFLMYLHECGQARDATALHYRYIAHDMYMRLKFDHQQPSPENFASDPAIAQQWQALSATMWGLYSFDTILGLHYGYIPQIPMPAYEKYFTDLEGASDQLWIPYPSSSDGIRYKKRETFWVLCELSKLFRRLLYHSKAEDVADGSPEDISVKAEIYQELLDLKSRNPIICADLADSAAHTYALMYYYNTIALSAFRPLQVLPDVNLPNGLGTPRELCFKHANELISVSDQYRKKFSFKFNCGLTIAGPYMVAFTLLPQLDDSARVAEPFTKACQYIREYVPKLDLLRYSLRALEALALLHKVQIPSNALQYFRGLEIDDAILDNVPITLMTAELPLISISQSSNSGHQEVNKVKLKIEPESMRELLARWSNLTLSTPGSSAQASGPEHVNQQNQLKHNQTI